MKITDEALPQSRIKYTVEIDEAETAEFFTEAAENLAKKINVAGFRPGKAPANIVRGQVGSDELREEAYALAARQAWSKIAETSKVLPIEDPSVEVEKFEEGSSSRLVFSFDIRPEVKVKDWRKIKADKVTVAEVSDEEVDEVIKSLGRAHAKTLLKLEPAVVGDKLEVTFSGSINGVKKDKLTANKFQLILGQGGVVPGFEDNLMGVRRGDKKSFAVTFPKDHFDKDFAGQKIDFEVSVEDVFSLVLPAHDNKFAETFGHKTFNELLKAVKEDLVRHKEEEAQIQRKAKWLAEFDKRVEAVIPQSLLRAEIDRSRQAWSSFLAERNIKAEEWLERRNTTLEKLEADWSKAAESSVRIGLGLAQIAKELGKELKNDQDYQDFLEELVKSPN